MWTALSLSQSIRLIDGQTDRHMAFSWLYRALHYMQSHGKNDHRIIWSTVTLMQPQVRCSSSDVSQNICRIQAITSYPGRPPSASAVKWINAQTDILQTTGFSRQRQAMITHFI